ncbi:sel1 repeat family protein, partial [Verrucomicrobiales bacterium]|nr:sel1 repeat family protein [Verrucomicrobiales bacterium]
AEAVKWYRLAADQGYAIAQNSLGACYANGEGVPKDYKEAVKWYRLAADQGYARAQYNLGWCYRKGNGVPQDYVLAYMWYSVSGGVAAETQKKSLSRVMTPEQIAEAVKLSREWKPKEQ